MNGVKIRIALLVSYTVFLFIFPMASMAQKSGKARVDSLVSRISNNMTDEERSKILGKISFECYSFDPRVGLTYAHESIDLAKKAGCNSCLENAYNALGVNYQYSSQVDSALIAYNVALKIASEMADWKLKSSLLGNIGNVYLDKGQYVKAMEYDRQALQIDETMGDSGRVSVSAGNIGSIYYNEGNYLKSMQYYYRAMRLTTEQRDTVGISINMMNIADVYQMLGDYDNALKFFKNVIVMNEKTGDKNLLAAVKNNIGQIYTDLHKYDDAKECFRESMSVYDKMGNKKYVALNCEKLSLVSMAQKNFSDAYSELQTAIELYKDLNDSISASLNQARVGDLILNFIKSDSTGSLAWLPPSKEARLHLASDVLKAGLATALKSGSMSEARDFYKSLSDCESMLGNDGAALNDMKDYLRISDSINLARNSVKLVNLVAQNELDLKDKDIEIKSAQLKNDKLQKYIFILSIIFLLGIIGLVVRAILKKKSENVVLTQERVDHLDRIEKQNKVLRQVAYDQSHKVRGPVTTIMGLAELVNLDDPTDPNNKELIRGISDVTKKLDEVLREMVGDVNRAE